ncbi:hypothetical protein [Methylogaea oryzae]|nr:hypothetical protein [Methylogaea oryzae]
MDLSFLPSSWLSGGDLLQWSTTTGTAFLLIAAPKSATKASWFA